MELEAQSKDKREVTEEPKRFMMQEMSRGFSFFDKALLVFFSSGRCLPVFTINSQTKKKKDNYSWMP